MTKTLSKTSKKSAKPVEGVPNDYALLSVPYYLPVFKQTKGLGELASKPGLFELPAGFDDSEIIGYSAAFPKYPCKGYLMPASSLIQTVFLSGILPTTPDGWMKAFNNTPGFNKKMGPVMFCHALMGGLLLLIDEEMQINPHFGEVLEETFKGKLTQPACPPKAKALKLAKAA